MVHRERMWAGCVALLTAVSTYAVDGAAPKDIQVTHFGYVGIEAGQIVKGVSAFYQDTEILHAWQERMLYQFGIDAVYKERIRVVFASECQLTFSYAPQIETYDETRQPKFSFYPDRAEGMYSFGNVEKPFLQLGLGYFPYQFNPDVRNLGEFLFRSGTYPLYVLNYFNQPYQRLLGVRLSSTLFDTFHQDLLLTSETRFPLMDWSLSYLARYTLLNFLEVGAGITWARLFSVNDDVTSPEGQDLHTNEYITESGDTAYVSFKGTKGAARLALDPKNLLPPAAAAVFGKDDARVYGEACIVGFKSYPNFDSLAQVRDTLNYYADWKDRFLWMVGFNVPMFDGLLDRFRRSQYDAPVALRVLSGLTLVLPDLITFELEYFPSTYPNSYYNVKEQYLPYPTLSIGKQINPWKWSVYARRRFFERFELVAQFARDHMKPRHHKLDNVEMEDVLPRAGDWWWMMKLKVSY